MADHASSEIDDLIELPLPVGSDIALEAISLIGGRSWPRPTRQPPALWLAEQGRGISASHANRQITRHTAAVFGPHGFRDALAMTVAITAPEQIKLVVSLLGHCALGAAHRHYNLARGTEAALAWHRCPRASAR